jgi:NDP-sugar pyrophosphorylase family protein
LIQRAVILAVGNPWHRSQLIYNRPRAMLPALGKPLVVRTMNRLHRFGIQQFTVVVGDNEGAVAAYLNRNWVPNAKMEFILKSNHESIAQVLTRLVRQDNRPFLITSYNTFTHSQFPESLLKLHKDHENELILSGAQTTLSKAEQQYFVLREGPQVQAIVSQKPETKHKLMLADLALCGQAFVDYLSIRQGTGSFHKQLLDIMQQYVQTKGAATLAETAWILQISTDYDLLTLSKHLLDEGLDAHILSEIPYTVQITPPVRIDPQVSVGQGAKIGPYVYLERGCSIGHEATVRNALILEQASVPAKATIANAIISSRGALTP